MKRQKNIAFEKRTRSKRWENEDLQDEAQLSLEENGKVKGMLTY